MQNTQTFKSHFEYYDQIFLNTTSWVLQLSYNLSTLEHHATELLEACNNIPGQLKDLRNEIEVRRTPLLKQALFVHTNNGIGFDFLSAQDTCLSMGPKCEMAEISSLNDEKLFLETLENNDINQALINYYTDDGEIKSKSQVLPIDHFLAWKKFHARICPKQYRMKYYHPDTADCFHFVANNSLNTNGFYYNWGTTYCHELSRGDIYAMDSPEDMQKLRFDFKEREYRKDWWIFGSWTSSPNLPVCSESYKLSFSRSHFYYDINQNCVITDDSESTHGVICHLDGDTRDLTLHSSDMDTLLQTKFIDRPGAVILKTGGLYTIQDRHERHPTMCQCTVNEHFETIHSTFKKNLLLKIDSAHKSINQVCENVLMPIKNSPYIDVTEPDSAGHRDKRFLGAIMSAFRSSSGLFANIARQAPAASGHFKQLLQPLGWANFQQC